jgi:hypothetical protein
MSLTLLDSYIVSMRHGGTFYDRASPGYERIGMIRETFLLHITL